MNAKSNWWESFFEGLVVDFWRAVTRTEDTRAEADFLEKHLALPGEGRVLDVPCGDGRLALLFAARGYAVTGVDISAGFLDAARAQAAQRGLAIAWRRGDMRELPWREEFDGAFCAGSSFGYFDEAGNQAFLDSVCLALKPGARFLLETGWTAESLLPAFRERLETEVSGIRFLAENRYVPETGRVENRFTITRGEQSQSQLASHRAYTYRQVTDLLEKAGFQDFEAYGSVSGEPFRLGSPKLILVVRKSG